MVLHKKIYLAISGELLLNGDRDNWLASPQANEDDCHYISLVKKDKDKTNVTFRERVQRTLNMTVV